MALLQPGFFDAVIALGIETLDKKKKWFATGFLLGYFLEKKEEQNTYRIYLVTNRHVLEGQNIVHARFDGSAGGVLEFEVPLFDVNKNLLWIAHKDKEIDIAVIRLNADFLKEKGAHFNLFRSDSHVITRSDCKKEGIIEGDGLFLLGFPMGIVGDSQNYVVVRGGNIARIRDCLDFKSKTFLVSIPTFPGNSGGPLLTKPEVVSMGGTKAFSKGMLIGIISAYLPYQDIAISLQTNRPRVTFEENSGLSIAYPSDFILEVINEAERTIKNESHPEPVLNESCSSVV